MFRFVEEVRISLYRFKGSRGEEGKGVGERGQGKGERKRIESQQQISQNFDDRAFLL